MSILAMLFGAGVQLFNTRAEERDRRASVLHYNRMMWLLVFGLMHAYLIRYGDILVLYATLGMLLVFAPWWLKRFRFGPLEWLWRTLTYGRLEPLARQRATPTPVV